MPKPIDRASHRLRAARRRLAASEAGPRASASADETLERVGTLSQLARAMWFSLLAYLAFVTLTLVSVRDVDFFSLERAIALPLVNIAIPTESFFLAAPALGAALHVYLHLHLLKLWDAVAALPATVGGRPVGERMFPWMIGDWALRRRPDRAEAATLRPMARLADATTFLLVWAAAPMALAAIWWRSMPAHEEALTLLIAAPLLVALYASRRSLERARRRLAAPGAPPPPETSRARVVDAAGFAAIALLLAAVSWARTEGGFDHAANRLIDAWEAAFGPVFVDMVETPEGLITLEEARRRGLDGQTLYSSALAPQDAQARWVAARVLTLRDLSRLGEDGGVVWTPLAPLDLRGADLARQPADWLPRDTARAAFRDAWCAARGLSPVACHAPRERDFAGDGLTDRAAFDAARTAHVAASRSWCAAQGGDLDREPVCAGALAALERRFDAEWAERRTGYLAALPRPDMRSRDLRGADAAGAFLAGLDFSGARLNGADFTAARMEGARLRGAQAADALFLTARLESADFRDARMPGVNLNQTRLDGADLRWAQMEGALLYDARMDRAALDEARLDRAYLSAAHLNGASLYRARLREAVLSNARLRGARLDQAQLQDADLSGAQLQNADLGSAHMERADLRRARMAGADLEGASMQGATLAEASLQGATLAGARMEGADLTRARMDRAILDQARMTGATLESAEMTSASLVEARLAEANLRDARMDGADLREASFRSAVWSNEAAILYIGFQRARIGASPVHGADFSEARDLTQAQLDAAIGDDRTRLPPGLHVWSCWETPPPGFEALVARHATAGRSSDSLRAEWLCGDRPRDRVGRSGP